MEAKYERTPRFRGTNIFLWVNLGPGNELQLNYVWMVKRDRLRDSNQTNLRLLGKYVRNVIHLFFPEKILPLVKSIYIG